MSRNICFALALWQKCGDAEYERIRFGLGAVSVLINMWLTRKCHENPSTSVSKWQHQQSYSEPERERSEMISDWNISSNSAGFV